MKPRNRFLCLLLALVLLVSTLPLQAFATDTEKEKKTTGTATVKVMVGSKVLYTYTVEVGDKAVTLSDARYIKHNNKYYEFSYYTVSAKKPSNNRVTIDAFDAENETAWKTKWDGTIKVIYKTHSHKYHFGYGRVHHWKICDCGHTTNEVRHVDPATDADKTCTCGYKFSDNADLTTLWLEGMTLYPRFNSAITEYTAEILTYQDVTSTRITAFRFDELGYTALPENLEVKEGLNKYEITVTAEDKTATKTYTVTAVKPVAVEDAFLYADGTSVSAALKPTVAQQTATAILTPAVWEKLVELAVRDKVSTVTLTPKFSQWSASQAEVLIPGDFLKAVAGQTEAVLTVQTPFESTLTIPREQLTAMAEHCESITVRINKDNVFDVLTVGTPYTASQEITLTTPEDAQPQEQKTEAPQ